MSTQITPGIYVPDSERNLIHIDEWIQREDKNSAETIVLVTNLLALEISKKNVPCNYVNWYEAQEAAANFREGFRCMTRHEGLEIYDWRFKGLDEALLAIDGDSVTDIYWTCESDAEPEYYSSGAWCVDLSYGGVYNLIKSMGKNRVRAVSAFALNFLNLNNLQGVRINGRA